MSDIVKLPTPAEKLRGFLFGWGFYPIADTPVLSLPRCRDEVGSLSNYDWGPYAAASTRLADLARMPRDGVANGTPMQLGHPTERRTLYWGGGYGTHESNRTTIPLPHAGAYWVTGHPSLAFDKRCIVAGPDGVHELIQFDQLAPRRDPGWAQQALGWGLWVDGQLVDGRATTASDLGLHRYIWGPLSAAAPHQQAFTLPDYRDGDGTDEFAAKYPNGPRCGDWVALDPNSESYRKMVALGGECKARAEAFARKGARISDRGGSISVLTQAGRYWAGTNNHLFTVALKDLRAAA
jgi:hypothetical protein